jgi:anti-sigma28 factor (negative regulator of flagellin synthesis)
MTKISPSHKVMDVKSPGSVAPESTTRPLVVTNRPVLANDPMMVAKTDAGTEPASGPEQVIHTTKKIQPINADVKPEEDEAAPEVADKGNPEDTEQAPESLSDSAQAVAPEPVTNLGPSADTEKPEAAPAEAAQTEAVQNTASEADAVTESVTELHDPEAEKTQAEAAALEAEAKRTEELEALIAKGTYAVPIDAQHKKRSRITALVVTAVIVVAALVAVDVLLDMGTLSLPFDLPHTNFFTT